MRPLLPGARGGLLLEYLLMLGVMASVAWVATFYVSHHYLPQPFVFDTFDTFMYWFNTATYANRPGAYDVWHTVYPPLSFVFLDIFSFAHCYKNPFLSRYCDWLGVTTILFFYGLAAVLAFITFQRADRATAIPRGTAFAVGFPLLFCLERGNLILVCLTPFIIAYGNIAVPERQCLGPLLAGVRQLPRVAIVLELEAQRLQPGIDGPGRQTDPFAELAGVEAADWLVGRRKHLA